MIFIKSISPIKKGKIWIDEENFGLDYQLYYLNIKEKQKFKIMYDYGDSWEFIVTLAKISISILIF